MTKAEFDMLDSNGKHPCPDCGEQTTHPYPGCGCPMGGTRHGYSFTRHVNKYHHTCAPEREDEQEQRDTWAYLKEELDKDRLGRRKLFP